MELGVQLAMEYYYEDELGEVYKIYNDTVYTWSYSKKEWILNVLEKYAIQTFCKKINPKESNHPAFVKIRFYENLLKKED